MNATPIAVRRIAVKSGVPLDGESSDVQDAATADASRVGANGAIGQDQYATAPAIKDATAISESGVAGNGGVDEGGDASSNVAETAATGNRSVVTDGGAG